MNLNLSYSLETLNSGQNWHFIPCDLEIWRMTLKNNRAPLLCYFKLCASFCIHRSIQTGVTVRKRLILVKINYFFLVWPWYLTNDIEAQQAPLVYSFKLCASFHSNRSIQLELQFGNATSGWKLAMCFPCNLEIWRMTLKTIGHLFYATSNFLHHFLAICELKLDSRPGNAQFGSKSASFSCVTLKVDR